MDVLNAPVRQQLKDLSLLERCLKETLRLRPPIMTMMRMARSPQVRAPPPSSSGGHTQKMHSFSDLLMCQI